MGIKRHRKLKTVAEKRLKQGYSEEQFFTALQEKSIPDDIARAIFDQMQKWASTGVFPLVHLKVADFPVSPEDELSEMYGIVDEDIDDLGIDLAKECGRFFPKGFKADKPVKTLEDLAIVLASLPRVDQAIE